MKNRAEILELETSVAWPANDSKAMIIAGPCSAESEEQVMEIARRVAKIDGISAFRAGVWKPRTRPNSFEGVGVEGLGWLKRVKEETGLSTAVEVANANHVYEALKHGIDILWIGARTTVNPFSVQEIANALRGADVPVWVKNPVNPDLQLWLGALERLSAAGIIRLGAIHRGFSTHQKTVYRNIPKWNLPIELKRIAPEIPLLCDPSHIAGNRDYLAAISQKALDLAMDGLMVETHHQPENALSDAAQQITPEVLQTMLSKLHFRQPGDAVEQSHLEVLRNEIDSIDHEILELLSRRNEMSNRIGHHKKEHNMTIYQVKRWDHLFADRITTAKSLGLSDRFITEFYEIVHQNSIRIQEEIMNSDD